MVMISSRPVLIVCAVLLALSFGIALCADSSGGEAMRNGMRLFDQFHRDHANFARAAAAFTQAGQVPALAYEAKWRLAELQLCLGTVESERQKKIAAFERGIAYANEAVALDSRGKEGHYFIAVNIGGIVQIDGAMKNLRRVYTLKKEIDAALEIAPNYAQALVVRARIMLDVPAVFGGSDEKAEALFRRAIQANPNYETAYIEYAKFLVTHNRFAEAKKAMEPLQRADFPHRYQSIWQAIEVPRVNEVTAAIEAGLAN